MGNNKLNLLVQFTGVDKMTGAMRNITAGSKRSSDAIRNMSREVRSMERDLTRVNRELAKGGSRNGGLIMAQRELTEAIARTNAELDKERGKLERVNNIRSRASSIAGGAAKAGAVMSATATPAMIAFGKHAFEAAMDAEELTSFFHVTFGKNGPMMEAWAERTGGALKRTKVEMMELSNIFGTLFTKADPAKATEMSQQFAVLAQDISSAYNIDPTEAMEKLRSGLVGESEPLRAFGVLMNDAAVKAQALKMGLKPVGKEFSEQQKMMARAAFIMENTKDAQGDLIRTSGSTSNQLRAANTAWENMSLTIGKDLIPAVTPAILAFTNLIKSFSGLSPETRKWILILGGGIAIFGPLLVGIAGVVSAIGTLAPLVAGISLPFLAVAAAVGLVAYTIYTNWNGIQYLFTAGIAWIKGAFNALPGWMKSISSMMMEGLLMSLNPALLVTRLLSVARTGIAAFKDYFGIKSPSRLFMEMGGHINDGLGIGIERGKGRPVRALGRMAGAVAGAGALALSPAAAAPRASGPVNVSITVNQLPGEDSQALAQRVARLVEKAQQQKRLRSYGDDF